MSCPDCGADYTRRPDTDEPTGCACEHAEPLPPTPAQADAFLASLTGDTTMHPPRTILARANVTPTDILLALIALVGLWALAAEAARVGL